MQYFSIYPSTRIESCKACPFRNETECTYTGGPQFTRGAPDWIHGKCPKSKPDDVKTDSGSRVKAYRLG